VQKSLMPKGVDHEASECTVSSVTARAKIFDAERR